jgi:hypothetical protein
VGVLLIRNRRRFQSCVSGTVTQCFLTPSSVLSIQCCGSGKNPDPESGINIPYPQHWLVQF